jgi:hypothetical protein
LDNLRNKNGIKPWIGEIGCADLYGSGVGNPEVQDYYLTKLVRTALADETGYAIWETITHGDRYDPLLPELFG